MDWDAGLAQRSATSSLLHCQTVSWSATYPLGFSGMDPKLDLNTPQTVGDTSNNLRMFLKDLPSWFEVKEELLFTCPFGGQYRTAAHQEIFPKTVP